MNSPYSKVIGFLSLVLLIPFSALAQQRSSVRVEAAKAEQRVALVIGNGAYETAPLKNPVNDAEDMAQALRELGFDVIQKENLNQNDMKRAIREFGEKIKNGGVALFYYAGHGTQVNGSNYLVPIGAQIDKEEEIEYESVDAGFVLAQMDNAGNRMNIVILDACRNNPFARSFRSATRGLAQMNAPSGTLIAYATAPGSVASDGTERNGLYTQELLRAIRTSGLAIEEVFKRVRISVRDLTKGNQTPWESSSLVGDFYFAGTNKPPIGEARPSNSKTTSSSPDRPRLQAEAILNINGVWRYADDRNTVFQIIQKGSQFQGTVTGMLGVPYKSTHTGTVSGRNVTMNYTTEFQNGFKTTGKCDGVVTSDGKTMNLMCTDSSAGTFPANYLRQ
jgi:Caspase domain